MYGDWKRAICLIVETRSLVWNNREHVEQLMSVIAHFENIRIFLSKAHKTDYDGRFVQRLKSNHNSYS